MSYVDFLNLSEERRKQLKKQYYFDCTCEHCTKKIKDDLLLAVKDEETKVRVLVLILFILASELLVKTK